MTPVQEVDRVGRTASKAYRQMARRLTAEARRHELKGRPLHAAKVRSEARLAMRAAWAEELDDAPAGLDR